MGARIITYSQATHTSCGISTSYFITSITTILVAITLPTSKNASSISTTELISTAGCTWRVKKKFPTWTLCAWKRHGGITLNSVWDFELCFISSITIQTWSFARTSSYTVNATSISTNLVGHRDNVMLHLYSARVLATMRCTSSITTLLQQIHCSILRDFHWLHSNTFGSHNISTIEVINTAVGAWKFEAILFNKLQPLPSRLKLFQGMSNEVGITMSW